MGETDRSRLREQNLTELRERAAHGDSDAVAELLDIGDERTDAADLSEYDLGEYDLEGERQDDDGSAGEPGR